MGSLYRPNWWLTIFIGILLLFGLLHVLLNLNKPLAPPSALTIFDLTYPTPLQLQSRIIPHNEYNPKQLNIYQLVAKCLETRQTDLYNEDNTRECPIFDPHPAPTRIEPHKHPECHSIKLFLQNEFQLCTYDTSHYIHKANIKQPINFISQQFGDYFEQFRQSTLSSIQSIPIPNEHQVFPFTPIKQRIDNGIDPINHPFHEDNNTQQQHNDDSSIHNTMNNNKTTTQQHTYNHHIIPQHDITSKSEQTTIDYIYSQYMHYYSTLHLPLLQHHVKIIRSVFGVNAKCGLKLINSIYSKSKRFTILEQEPWYNIHYIRDSLRAKIRINQFDDIKPIISLFLLHGYTILQADYDKFTQPKSFWGWRPISIDLRYVKATTAPTLITTSMSNVYDPITTQTTSTTTSSTTNGILNEWIDVYDDIITSFIHTLSTPLQQFIQQHQQLFYSQTSIYSFLKPFLPSSITTTTSTPFPQHNPDIDIAINTGFVIELYFVPYHMDIKITKLHNHHLYEKWRNLSILPIFHNQLAIEHTRLNQHLPPRPIDDIINIIQIELTKQLQQVQQQQSVKLLSGSEQQVLKSQQRQDEQQQQQQQQQIKPIYTNEQLQQLWIDFQNDIFWSSLTYTNALHQWWLASMSQTTTTTPPSTTTTTTTNNDSDNNHKEIHQCTQDDSTHTCSMNQQQQQQQQNNNINQHGIISQIEDQFYNYINNNLIQCLPQCQYIWDKHQKNDLNWYTSIDEEKYPNR